MRSLKLDFSRSTKSHVLLVHVLLVFLVETRNGHLKSIWKHLDTVLCSYDQLNLSDDIEICSALINKYFTVFGSNAGRSSEVVERMLSKLNMENEVGRILSDNFNKSKLRTFTLFENFDDLPIMPIERLFWVSLSDYTIRQAISYTQMHIKQNNNFFDVFICPEEICRKEFSSFGVADRNPALFMMKINSRFRSQKTHRTFVLIDRYIQDEETYACDESAVLGHYCECYNGWRTVGCCSHIMTLIAFLLVTKGRDLKDPAAFLNNFFD